MRVDEKKGTICIIISQILRSMKKNKEK